MKETLAHMKKVYIDEDRPIPKIVVFQTACILLTIGVLALVLFTFVLKRNDIAKTVLYTISGIYIFLALYSIKFKGLFNSAIVKKKNFIKCADVRELIDSCEKRSDLYTECMPIFEKMGITISKAYLDCSSNRESGNKNFSKYCDMFSRHIPKNVRYTVGDMVYEYCIKRGLDDIDASDLAFVNSAKSICSVYMFANTILYWSDIQKQRLEYLFEYSDKLSSEFDSIIDKMEKDKFNLFNASLRSRLAEINQLLAMNLDEIKEIEISIGLRLEDDEKKTEVGVS